MNKTETCGAAPAAAPSISVVTLTEDEFTDRFQPQGNHLNDNASYGGCLYETYGDEYEYVKSIHAAHPELVWTVLDVDGFSWIVNGLHFVDRMGYLLCGVAVKEGEQYQVKEDTPCVRFYYDENHVGGVYGGETPCVAIVPAHYIECAGSPEKAFEEWTGLNPAHIVRMDLDNLVDPTENPY